MSATNYKRRETVNIRVDTDYFEFDIQEQNTEKVVLQWRADEEYPERRDMGSLCYLDRLSGKKYAQVNTLSLCETRKKAIKKILLAAATMSYEHVSYVRAFINFIDYDYCKPCNLFSENDLKKSYIAYTQHLKHLLQLSKINKLNKGIGSKSASRKQHGAMQTILALLENITEEAIKTWAPIISRKETGNNLPIIRSNNEHYPRMFAIHLRLFVQITDFLLYEKKLPLILDMQGLELPYEKINLWTAASSSESSRDKTEWKYWGLKNTKLLDWPDINLLAKKDGYLLSSNQYDSYRKFKSIIEASNYRPNQGWKHILANRAVTAFCYGLMADSGTNWESLRNIDFDNVTFVKELDKTRLISLKARAEGKTQHIEMNIQFKPFFKKYQKLRKWMGVKKRYGIFRYGYSNNLKLIPSKPESSNVRNQFSYLLEAKVPWVNARDWRWNVSYEYLSASNGDIRMVTRVLGNQMATVRKHYGFSSFETSATELSTFYGELTQFAHRRVRLSQEIIPVKITYKSARTLTGGCEGKNAEDAFLVKGFTEEAPQPDCSTPVTCFMCENYALHADEHDFKKILSAKYWLESQGRKVAINNDEFLGKYQPIIERIEEIIAQALMLSSEIKSLITSISQQIDAGKYDPYWQVQIDALIDGGLL